MTIFVQDLRTFLLSSTAFVDTLGSTTAVFYNHTPQSAPRAYLWYRTATDTVHRTMDGVGGIHEAHIDMEVVAETETAVQSAADALHNRLDGYKGAVSNSSAKGMFLTDKDDSYEPRGVSDDSGFHVIAYDLHVWYST